jgi:Icc-related predicted phosphoesterase
LSPEKKLKFLCLTDYHGAYEHLSSIPAMVQKEDPDVIFYCGGSMKGDKRRLEYETARKFHSKPDSQLPAVQQEIAEDSEYLQHFLLALADTQKAVYVIPGCNDVPESFYFKTAYNYAHIYPNLRPVHEMMVREDQFMVAGFGGDVGDNEDNREFILQYSRTWVEFALRRLEYFPGEKILLFHSPPVCRLDLSDGEHCGVLMLNELIERVAPQLVLCGRARSGQGRVKLGPTVVVNPGPFFEGHYAVIDYPSLEVQFKNIRPS